MLTKHKRPGLSCLATFCSHWFETSNPRTAIIGFVSGTALILVSMTMQGSSKLKGMIQRALNKWRKHATLENQKKRRSNHPTTRIQEKHRCYILLQASIMLFATPVFLVSAPVGLIHKIFSAHAAHVWFCSELNGSLSSYRSSGIMASWPHQTNPASVPLQSNSFTPVKVVELHEIQSSGQHFGTLIFANSTSIRWHVLYLSVNVIPLWNQNASMSMLSLPCHSQFTAEARHRSVWTATVQVAAEPLLCLQFSTKLDRKDAEDFERINII